MPTVEYLNYETMQEEGWNFDDDDLFEKAADADLDSDEYGSLEVEEDESILNTAESQGYNWPYGCRSGMCATCSAVVISGEIDISGQRILDDEQIEDGSRVTCIGTPDTDEVQIVYNAKSYVR